MQTAFTATNVATTTAFLDILSNDMYNYSEHNPPPTKEIFHRREQDKFEMAAELNRGAGKSIKLK